MKRFYSLFVAALLLVASFSASAGVLLGSLSAVTTAVTNSPTFQTNTIYVPVPELLVSNGNLTSTNSYSGVFRFSFDNVTFYTNGPVFTPSSTNAATSTVEAQTIAVTIYTQVQATTNAAPSNTGVVNIGVVTP